MQTYRFLLCINLMNIIVHFPLYGIIKINNKQDFLNFDPKNGKIPYILQYAAHEEKEYEVFYIRDAANQKCLSTPTVNPP
jgi:hypothetical protein